MVSCRFLAASSTEISAASAAFLRSSYVMCAETAHEVAAHRRLEVQVEQRLIEVGYGRWTGRPFGQLTRTELWKRIQSSPSSIRFPEGESLTEVQRRGVEALEAIASGHPRS